MGAITLTNGTITGSVTVANNKITNVLSLYGESEVEDFATMTPQQKADAVALALYEHAKMVAGKRLLRNLAQTRAAEDAAALETL